MWIFDWSWNFLFASLWVWDERGDTVSEKKKNICMIHNVKFSGFCLDKVLLLLVAETIVHVQNAT